MRFPPIKHYSNIQLTPSFLGEGIHVDDVVYYISPSAEYAIKKGAVIAKNVIQPSHHFRMFPSVELTLDNGDVVLIVDNFSLTRSQQGTVTYASISGILFTK